MQAEAQSGEKSQTTRAHARCVENVVWTLPRWKAWNTGLGFPEKSNQQNPYISSPGSPRSADSKDPGELMLQNRSKSKSKARAHRCTSLRTIRQRERERERERGKIVSSLASAFCSVQARSRLEEVHSHWGGQGALFSLTDSNADLIQKHPRTHTQKQQGLRGPAEWTCGIDPVPLLISSVTSQRGH